MFRPTSRVAALQLVILLAAAGFIWFVWGEMAALSAAYGVAVALIITLLMLARERESEAHAEWTAQRQLGQFFRLEAERFILAIALLAAGFLSGKTEPLALISGFVLGQLGWAAALKKP
ncbi:MAG: ATP synthase subunit I [Pseudomonadota bacterium]